MSKKIIMWCLLVFIGFAIGGYFTVAKSDEPIPNQVPASKEGRAAPSQEKSAGQSQSLNMRH